MLQVLFVSRDRRLLAQLDGHCRRQADRGRWSACVSQAAVPRGGAGDVGRTDRCVRRHRVYCRAVRHRLALVARGPARLVLRRPASFFVVVPCSARSRIICRFSIFKLIRYLREEVLICFATTSSETVLPQLIAKMEASRLRGGRRRPGRAHRLFVQPRRHLPLSRLRRRVPGAGDQHAAGASSSRWRLLLVLLLVASKGAAGHRGCGVRRAGGDACPRPAPSPSPAVGLDARHPPPDGRGAGAHQPRSATPSPRSPCPEMGACVGPGPDDAACWMAKSWLHEARLVFRTLTPVERRTYWACFGGFGLDSMDTTMYALVIPSLIAVLGITQARSGLPRHGLARRGRGGRLGRRRAGRTGSAGCACCS